jgi:D-glycero-D-manno-heptose 1,7-bisphosphate phosphatase
MNDCTTLSKRRTELNMPLQKRFVILDRDGVINHDSPLYIKSPDEWRPIEGSLKAISALVQAGIEIAVITNQSAIGRGLISEETLKNIHTKMTRAVEQAGGRIAAIYYCPHHPNDGCACRKPALGMLKRLEIEHGVLVDGIPLIGDKLTDIELAKRAGARPILVRTGYGEESLSSVDKSVAVYKNLACAVEALLIEGPT